MAYENAAQAADLFRALKRASAALALQLEARDDGPLGDLELSLDDLLAVYRGIISEISDDGITIKRSVDTSIYWPLFRAMVCFSTILDLTAPHITMTIARVWGKHIFSERDFALISFDTIGTDLSHAAIVNILPDQADDLIGAVRDIVALIPPTRAQKKLFTVISAMDRICASLGAPTRKNTSLGFELKGETFVLGQLGNTSAQLKRMIRNRQIIAVRAWTGEFLFPDYQFVAGKFHPAVQIVLENASPDFRGWPLAVWMAENRGKDEAQLAKLLGGRGLWRPYWKVKDSTAFDTLDHTTVPSWPIARRTNVFRVSRNDFSPFYFSSAKPRPRGSRYPPPAGRYDLPSSKRGSLYLAEKPTGAWSETLDREPLVTLREVLRRTMWTLSPAVKLEIADLEKGPPELFSTVNRLDTQAVADEFDAAGRRGMRTILRSIDEIGYVVFGPTGPRLPMAAGLGFWEATPTPGIRDAGLWEYFDYRRAHHPDFPILLRRFPGEVEFSR